ncbi:TY-Chap domain-containing protein [Streptomyces sp. NPDC088746]|uniref:TY-Chap domain-containing protein n=1 Tax=Streptomyces sp. NPDC088746 TaxID=3365885 RepID=UPI00382A9F57
MTGWDGFSEGLAEQLASLPAGSVLIIRESGQTGRYAQFLQSDERVGAELVGDHHLAPGLRAGEAGCRLIAEAGWQLPEDTVYGHNWWSELPWPSSSVSYRELARMTVTGLRDGLRITGPQDLVYEAWEQRRGNRSLTLPLLGLTAQS